MPVTRAIVNTCVCVCEVRSILHMTLVLPCARNIRKIMCSSQFGNSILFIWGTSIVAVGIHIVVEFSPASLVGV